MKNIIVTLIIVSLFSCSDPEAVDPIEGGWSYISVDHTNTKPVIATSFILKASGSSYTVNNLTVSIDGNTATDYTTSMEGVVKGDKINRLILSKGNDVITMYKCDILVSNPAWTIDSVVYTTPGNKYKYIGGTITK